jgi:hypothetical protein
VALRLTRRVPAWNGDITGGNTLTLKLPIGLTLHQLWTEYTFSDGCCALALADAVDQVRVVANGKPIWNLLASELDTMNIFQGRTAAGGILAIDFDRYNLRTRQGEELTSIGTGSAADTNPVTTLHVEFDLKAAVMSGTLDSRIVSSESRPLGLIKKLRRFVNQFSASGTVEIADFPLGDLIDAVYFYESANDIDRVRLERDDYVMFDRTKELNSRIQTDGVRVPQTNLFVYDTSESGNGIDQLLTRYQPRNGETVGRLVNDLRWFLTLDGAMTVTSIVSYLGGLER